MRTETIYLNNFHVQHLGQPLGCFEIGFEYSNFLKSGILVFFFSVKKLPLMRLKILKNMYLKNVSHMR